MSKYETLDRLIMAKIGGHPQMFSAIYVRDVCEECKRLVAEGGAVLPQSGADPSRACDRRLQALRRLGKIRSTTKGWIRVGEKGSNG